MSDLSPVLGADSRLLCGVCLGRAEPWERLPRVLRDRRDVTDHVLLHLDGWLDRDGTWHRVRQRRRRLVLRRSDGTDFPEREWRGDDRWIPLPIRLACPRCARVNILTEEVRAADPVSTAPRSG